MIFNLYFCIFLRLEILFVFYFLLPQGVLIMFVKCFRNKLIIYSNFGGDIKKIGFAGIVFLLSVPQFTGSLCSFLKYAAGRANLCRPCGSHWRSCTII